MPGGDQHADGRGAVGVEGIGVRDLREFVPDGIVGDLRPVAEKGGQKDAEAEDAGERRRAYRRDFSLAAADMLFPAVRIGKDGFLFPDAELPPDILFYRLVVGQNFRRLFESNFFTSFMRRPPFRDALSAFSTLRCSSM